MEHIVGLGGRGGEGEGRGGSEDRAPKALVQGALHTVKTHMHTHSNPYVQPSKIQLAGYTYTQDTTNYTCTKIVTTQLMSAGLAQPHTRYTYVCSNIKTTGLFMHV